MSVPTVVKRNIAVRSAVAALFLTSVGTAAPAEAGLKAELCTSTTDRGAIPDGFPLDACFDGTNLIIENNTVLPLYVNVEGAAGSSTRTGIGDNPALASRAFMETYRQESGLLMPEYRMTIPVGSGALKASVEHTSHRRTYQVVALLIEWVPGLSAIEPLITAANEMVAVYDQRNSCLNANGFVGDIGCNALYARNVTFAIGRLGVGVVGGVIGSLLSTFETVQRAYGNVSDGIDVDNAAPIQLSAVQNNVAPTTTQGPSQQVPSATLAFTVTGSCTSAGGVLGSSSANFSPGGSYSIRVWYPDGSAYTALSLGAGGTVRDDGTIAWQWDCTGDPAGTYTTEIVDNATGRSTGRVGFVIGGAVAAPTTVAQVAQTYRAQQASRGANTFSDPSGATGPGPRIEPNTWVDVSCKLKPATTIDTAYPDGYWYRIASSPWNNQYYAVANTFWNGDTASTPREQWHNTDMSIPDC